MQLEEYIKSNYPNLIEEHKRLTTPFYYEPGVLYHPIVSGFGCIGESKKPLKIVNGDYVDSGEVYITLQDNNKSDDRYIVLKSEAHKKIKRLDEAVEPVGNIIPNSRKYQYMTINGIKYTIYQAYWRTYDTKKLGGKIIVSRDCDQKVRDKQPYHELYSLIGKGEWVYRNVKSWDSIGREDYTINFKYTVRQFKQTVFGNADIKIKCELFS